MNIPITIISQVMVIFLLMFVGGYLFRTKKLTDTGTKQISNILLIFVMPSVLIHSMQIPFDKEMFRGLLWSFVLAILTHIAFIIITRFVLLRKSDDPYQIGVERCCVIMSNAGFFSLPIIQALWGAEGMFYATAYICVYNILSWTYMVKELTHTINGTLSLKSIL
ncbi:MAG: AEC family transporter, partial [Oscillospiraceae bacterium]